MPPQDVASLPFPRGGGVLLLGHPAPVPRPGLLGASHLLGVRGGQAGLFLYWTEKSRKWEKFILVVISGKVKLFLGRKQSIFICVCGSVCQGPGHAVPHPRNTDTCLKKGGQDSARTGLTEESSGFAAVHTA